MLSTIPADDPLQDEAEASAPSESSVKADVRERDGYKCRDCGMTAEEHQNTYGRALNVHRLIPGIIYQAHSCITLCEECHRTKPRNTGDAFWAKDLRWFGFNLYDEGDAALFRQLAHHAERGNVSASAYLTRILRQHFETLPPDYQI